jgi:hypothetical protein
MNCTKCGLETRNLVVCDACNKPPTDTKYYRHQNSGDRFFKVSDDERPVLQIISTPSSEVKKGKACSRGITEIKYISWLGSWSWRTDDIEWNKNITEIKQSEFYEAFDKIINEICKDRPVLKSQSFNPKVSPEIKNYAQKVTARTVSDINATADGIPDSVSILKEGDLLKSVIDELSHLAITN